MDWNSPNLGDSGSSLVSSSGLLLTSLLRSGCANRLRSRSPSATDCRAAESDRRQSGCTMKRWTLTRFRLGFRFTKKRQRVHREGSEKEELDWGGTLGRSGARVLYPTATRVAGHAKTPGGAGTHSQNSTADRTHARTGLDTQRAAGTHTGSGSKTPGGAGTQPHGIGSKTPGGAAGHTRYPCTCAAILYCTGKCCVFRLPPVFLNW